MQKKHLNIRLKKYHITFSHWHVLTILVRDGTQTLSQLALHTMIDRGRMTNLLDQLEFHQMITRHRNSKDRRTILIEPTDKGMVIANKGLKEIDEFHSSLKMHLEAKEILAVICLEEHFSKAS